MKIDEGVKSVLTLTIALMFLYGVALLCCFIMSEYPDDSKADTVYESTYTKEDK